VRNATAAALASVFISIAIASAQTGTPPPDSAAAPFEAGPSYTENPAAGLQSPGPPSFKFNSSDFWAQGINVDPAFGC